MPHQFYHWIHLTFILPIKSIEIWKLSCKEDLAKTGAKGVSDKTIQMQPTDETKLKNRKLYQNKTKNIRRTEESVKTVFTVVRKKD